MPCDAEGWTGPLFDGDRERKCILEYPDREYDRDPFGKWHLHYAGGDAPAFRGGGTCWILRWWCDAALGRDRDRVAEYRPTEYVQGWLSFWFDEKKRLSAAKEFQRKRCAFIERVWEKDEDLQDAGFYVDDMEIEMAIQEYRRMIEQAQSVTELLSSEARFTKELYKYAAHAVGLSGFTRDHSGEDQANAFLNHGNYLAYGLSAVTLWVLGIPHGFAVMHGKTRRGALVFDVADLIKDAVVLPWSFICSSQNDTEQQFRQQLLQKFTEHQVLDFMFGEVKSVSQHFGERR